MLNKIFVTSIKLGLLSLISLFILISCEEAEIANPADPNYVLDPPTLLSADAVTDTEIEIVWKNNEEHSKEFVISRKSGSGSYSVIGTVVKDLLAFTDTACVLGTEYSYVVQSKVSSNCSVNSNTLKKASTFTAPSNLTVSPISDESVRLTWIDNTGYETGFKIERDAGSGFAEIGTVLADIAEYTDTGLTYGQSYNYRIAAYTSANTSSWATITAATEFPAPSELTGSSVSDSEIQLTWTDNTGYETGFKIERDGGSGFTEIATVSADANVYTDSGLTFGQSYDYRVAAYTSANTSSWATITASTEFPAPSELTASSVSDSEIQLTWTDNTGYETGFKIERDAGSGFAEIGTVLADIAEYTDTGLTYGQSYNYRIAAYTSANTSSWATITAATEFPAPSGLVATSVSDSEIQLTWTDNTGYETGFKIERDGGSGFAEIGTVLADIAEYTDTGLTYGQSYNYRIAAFTLVNTSSWATITAATEFPAPSDLTASGVSDSEIRLTWIDNTGYETGFKIERGDDGSGFVQIGTVLADVIEFTDSGLTFDQSYDYRVAAYTASITSDYSSTATATATTPLVDWDGNTYGTVEIGNQLWMSENLKVTHYRDGTVISNVTDNADWGALTTEAYCINNNNASNEVDTYGALYNWYAVNGDTDGDGVKDKEIAPEGWHVPTDDEWTTLTNHLGGLSVAGGKLKETGTNHWISPNTGATNESGFTALPGGYRRLYGNYDHLSTNGDFWSATEGGSNTAWARNLHYYDSAVDRYYDDKRYGISVRCVRD